MRYDDPELRDRLAAEYVLGTMPIRARRRLQRLADEDPILRRAVEAWAARLAPADEATPEVMPPIRVWRAIERRVPAQAPRPVPAAGWFRPLRFWHGFALAGSAAAAAVLLYVAAFPPEPTPRVVAVLAKTGGEPAWVAMTGPRRGFVNVTAVGTVTEEPGRSFQLWGIASGAPRPLGLVHARVDRPFVIEAVKLPSIGGILAVSVEPPAGSPTGLPTGPVISSGKILDAPTPAK